MRARSFRFSGRRARRRAVAAAAVACVAAGAVVAGLAMPQLFSNAATTAVSTLFQTAKNATNGSTAASSDAPGGAKVGTAKPGDTLNWVVDYQNNTNAAASVNLKDPLTNAGTYVPGSLQLPPNANAAGTFTPQYSTDGGTTWAAGSPPANANGVGVAGTLVPPNSTGLQQQSAKFPPPASQTVTTAGGDGYNAVAYKNTANGGEVQVYSVFHHAAGNVVYCATLTGAVCANWPGNASYWSSTVGTPIGTGTQFPGKTAWQNGTWISGNKLFWLMGPSDNSSTGTACLDLSAARPTSCGYQILENKPIDNNWNGAQVGGTGLPSANTGQLYVSSGGNFNGTAGSNTVDCITAATGAKCGGWEPQKGNVTTNNIPGSAVFGNYIFTSVQQTTSSYWVTYCYNAGAINSACAGSWPVTTSAPASGGPTPLAPLLSTTGAVTGICTIINGGGSTSACWNLNGASVNLPYSGAQYTAGGNSAGDAYVIGTKVYLSGGDTVLCRDFATYTGTGIVPACAGFTPPTNNVNYTVRSASAVAPNCLVADGDGHQITFFNAVTGGGCTGVSGPVTMTVTPSAYYCGTGATSFRAWGTLTLPGLVPGTYTNSTVTLSDQNNTIIPGFNAVTLAAGGTLNLSSIPTSVTKITANVQVNGVNDPTGVTNGQISVSWQGDPAQICFQTTAPPVACDAAAPLTLSNTVNAVTTSTGGTDAPGGNTSGPAQFTVQAADSQCSLDIQKTSTLQQVRPGGKFTYTITVKNTGTQAYTNAQFTDDLTNLLKDVTFSGGPTASTGTARWVSPIVSWSGALAPGATATITFDIGIKVPYTDSNHSLVNTVTSPTRGNNCPAGSSDPKCTVVVTVLVTDLLWHKIDATPAKNILAGSAWTLTPVDGAGKPIGAAIAITDCVAARAADCTGADLDPLGGAFRLTNLNSGTYQLVETAAPVGFELNPTPVTVTIGTETTLTIADIVNKQLPVPLIPLTGGLGTDALTIAGGSLFAGVLGLITWQLIRRRRATS